MIKTKIKKVLIGISGFLVLSASTLPIIPPESLTIHEYQQVIGMYSVEIQKLNGVELVVENGELLKALNAKIRETEISIETEQLIQKVEKSINKTSLINRVIN